jgi:acyl carrier protein
MAIDDGLIGDLTAQRIQGVLAPKFGGAVNLDLQTRRDPIELFVLYSSATSVLGAPGQGSYVAANAALEWVARARAALGLPALAVAWGAIGDVGYLARHDKKSDALTRRLAVAPFTAREALNALPHLWSSGEPVVAFAAMKWDQAGRHLPVLASPTFAALAAHGAKGDVIDLAERLAELDTDAAVKLVLDVLREETAQIMLLAAERIDPYRALSEFGMDSLMAVELRLAVESRLGIDLPMLSLTASTTLSSIAMRIVKASSTGLDDDIVTAALHHETNDESVVELDVEALIRAQPNSGGQAP